MRAQGAGPDKKFKRGTLRAGFGHRRFGDRLSGILWAIIVIPLMMAIAIPNFVKARSTAQTNMCINNLRQIDAAKNQWALENSKTNGVTPTAQDLSPYIKGGFESLHCVAGGNYTIGPVGQNPTCSIPEHKLPE